MCFKKETNIVFRGMTDAIPTSNGKKGEPIQKKYNDFDLVWKSPEGGRVLKNNIRVCPSFSHDVFCIVDGKTQEYSEGACTVDTKNKNTDIYFVAKNLIFDFGWGTPSRTFRQDPILEVVISIGINGSAKAEITDTKKFLYKVVGNASHYTKGELKNFLLDIISARVGDVLYKIVVKNDISFLEIPTFQLSVSDYAKEILSKEFEQYGVTLTSFTIGAVDIPEGEVAQYNVLLKEKRLLKHHETSFKEIREEKKGQEAVIHDRKIETIGVLGELVSSFPDQREQTTVVINGATVKKSCSDCGTTVPTSAMFCPVCGKRLI